MKKIKNFIKLKLHDLWFITLFIYYSFLHYYFS